MKTDVQLKKDVQAELDWDVSVNATEIGVAVKDGVVTLTGHLDTYAEKLAVEKAVQRVQGVRAMAIELDIRLAPGHQRSDSEIAAAAEMAFKWNSHVPAERIMVKVEKGWVTLSGEVDWDYQRSEAESAVRPLTGVRGISNNIVLKVKAAPSDVTRRIRDALARQASRETDAISVHVTGSTVTLRGSVNSWADRSAAQVAAWSAPGVTSVINELRVGG